ncbi:dienelactone hydrolase [Anopheles sinensis]|uniref:Dienelactone hydrolase n=1 Tax=Anopheles sinensis TaxID=74873 RepID=A0A084WK94_ANOSI|nr:dienelactone hydrolase [Anopheles sinensis]
MKLKHDFILWHKVCDGSAYETLANLVDAISQLELIDITVESSVLCSSEALHWCHPVTEGRETGVVLLGNLTTSKRNVAAGEHGHGSVIT